MTSRRGIRACVGVATILAASLWAFVPAVPAAAVTPSITVTPNTGLVDGQTVTVAGSGWAAGDTVYYCEAVNGTPQDSGNCDPPIGNVTADGSGSFSVPVKLDRIFTAFNTGPVDCADPARTCSIGAAHLDLSDLTVVPLNFAPQPPVITPITSPVLEGNSGTTNLVMPVTLSYASTSTVTVDWTTPFVAGTPPQADPATDFTAASGTVTFAPGDTAKTVTISVNGDLLVEPDEVIPVTFTNPTNATIAGTGVVDGTITNDDHAVVLPGGAVVAEDNAGTTLLTVPVRLSNPSTLTITVQWFTGPAGKAPRADPATDFNAASGIVTFAPGQTAQTVSITVNGDTLVEPNEWVTISFNHPTNAKMGGFYGLGFGIIQNDD
jgi:hypothetical protein